MQSNTEIQPDEEIVFSTSLHWIRYGRPFIGFLVGLFIFEGWGGGILGGLIIAIIYGLWTKAVIKRSRFVVTNNRALLLMFEGPEIEILYSKKLEIRIRQNTLGEWLDCGVIVVDNWYESGNHTGSVRHPHELLKAIQEQKHNYELLSQVMR